MTLKRWATLVRVLTVLAIAIGGTIAINWVRTHTPTEDQKADIRTKAAESANKSLPIMVDQETRFDRVSTHANGLEFHYTLLRFSSADVDFAKARSAFQEMVLKNMCGSVADGDVTIVTYYGKDGKKLGSVSVAEKDCH